MLIEPRGVQVRRAGVLVLLVLLGTLLVAVSAARADHCPPGSVHVDSDDGTGRILSICASGPGGGAGGDEGDSGAGGSGSPAAACPSSECFEVRMHAIGTNPDGGECVARWTQFFREVPAGAYTSPAIDPVYIHEPDAYLQRIVIALDNGEILPGCTGAVAPNPGDLVGPVSAEVTERIAAPSAAIAPGIAVTGLRSYLELDYPQWGPDEDLVEEFSFVADLGVTSVTVNVRVVLSYVVDWGDGPDAVSERQYREAAPFPDGTVTWVYTEQGPRVVTAQERFDVSFTSTIGSAPVPSIEPAPIEVPLEVREYQAVVDD